jgi:hypothetical protein
LRYLLLIEQLCFRTLRSARGRTPEEIGHFNRLCHQIIEEKNPQVFNELVRQLHELLDKKNKRINPEQIK